ncbi:hypothetical protein SS1G_01987 [Sclerotinia sclerotiorum 1980 UF-70]|uniref:DNA 3'-5' helicase n=1 Tax=Sclerotinia sclerotiorum (strain ATCC 18683 / 1980 / Ss-1) TaxID=665079 RepID=A7E9K7_SCLS1|nr:hypothetical protein SS1G_01987 [Sclerotinia sclerotiorum 1980 UF-70]EDN97059.1 hypothetical protein SS1G_01987 [Sclerotinia sclerotiorum 1980 UF-70]
MAKSTEVDEYGFSSSDEADLLDLTNAVDAASGKQGQKRKAPSEQTSPVIKKQATEASHKVLESAISALNRNFGFKSFRLKQEQAISRILAGESAVVVFPTGGGKSLCFQVPALAFEEEDKRLNTRDEGDHGIVSPLIALMKDQVDALVRRGIAAATFDSKIARFAEEIQAERVVCLTATATPRVAKDICHAFNIKDSGLFRTSTYRPNLRLLAESGDRKVNMLPKLKDFLHNHKGSTIIYVTLQRQTEDLAQILVEAGFKAKAFHAGMQTEAKTKLQDEFMRSDDMIMVATIAFGMGIDKGAIRNVIHFSVPQSLESYSQEIGRSGRDGGTSNCFFFVCGEDLHFRELFARGDLPSLASIRGLLNDIFDSKTIKLPVGSEIYSSHYSQTKEFDIRPTVLGGIYAQLELTHGLIRATTPLYQKYSYVAEDKKYRAKITSDQSPAAIAIAACGEKKSKFHHIDVNTAADRYNIGRNEIIAKLGEWNSEGILDLKSSQVLNVYKVTKPLPKTASEIEKLAKAVHTTLETREQQDLERTDKILQLVTGKACFSKQLAEHFGDELPDGKEECGHCQWCLTHRPVEIQLPPPVPFNETAFREILSTIPDRDDPRFLARVAFGISTPRVSAKKLGRSPIFGSMEDHEFAVLLRAFEKECN